LIRRGLFDSAARERVCAKQASPLIASPMSAFTASSPPSSAATSTACSRPAVRARDRTGHWMTTIRLPPMSAAASSSSLRSGSVTDPAFIALRPRGQRTAARLRVARLYSCHRSRSRVSPVCSVSPHTIPVGRLAGEPGVEYQAQGHGATAWQETSVAAREPWQPSS
jgi:hypothetical protein